MDAATLVKIAGRYSAGMITRSELVEELIAAGATVEFARRVASKVA